MMFKLAGETCGVYQHRNLLLPRNEVQHLRAPCRLIELRKERFKIELRLKDGRRISSDQSIKYLTFTIL